MAESSADLDGRALDAAARRDPPSGPRSLGRVGVWSGIAGGAIVLLAAGAWLSFAPTREGETPPEAPIILPGQRGPLTIGHARPATSGVDRKAGRCGGAEQEVAIGPRPATPPQSWLNDYDYPMTALWANHQGITALELVIDPSGVVIGCGVATSSGHFSLDSKACTALRQRARFLPAEDARGCPIASVYRQRVRWIIPSR